MILSVIKKQKTGNSYLEFGKLEVNEHFSEIMKKIQTVKGLEILFKKTLKTVEIQINAAME